MQCGEAGKRGIMKPTIKYYTVTDIESTNPAMSNNGGDYYFGRTIAVNVSANPPVPLAVTHWTSAEFEYCPLCGKFETNMDEHIERWHSDKDRAAASDGEGWDRGYESSKYNGDDWKNRQKFVVIG